MTLLDLASCGGDPPFLWLHGFTHTARSGYEFQSTLRATRPLYTIDLPGHGSHASTRSSLPSLAGDIAEATKGRLIDLGGYSFGGRVALHVAASHSNVLRRLILLSATAGIVDTAERSQRRQRDNELADHIDAIGVDAFLREWLAQPMFQDLPVDEIEYATRSQDPRGLANALRDMGTGTQLPLDEALAHCVAPTLIIAGANDEKFVREANRLHEALPHSRVVVVPHAGHAAHLERPDYVADLIGEFLGEEDQ